MAPILGETRVLGRWGGEAIKWRVLVVEGNRVLVVSEEAVDSRRYHDERTDTTWEQCSLRRWLNEEFFNGAFDAAERSMISEMLHRDFDNPDFGTKGGADTYDLVFCLSIVEAQKYFNNDGDRTCYPTKEAKNNFVRTDDAGACDWWLRSPGYRANHVASVLSDGSVYTVGRSVDFNDIGVRPALWLNL